MIVILHPNIDETSEAYAVTFAFLQQLPGVTLRTHVVAGEKQKLTEVYLIGDTTKISRQDIGALPAVDRVVRISEAYRILGRHDDEDRAIGFAYNGLRFDQDSLHVFAGLCAVDSRESVDEMMRVLRDNGMVCTRMGAYKPRTSPYSFQGLGKACLPYVFDLAGQYGIKVVAMEVTHESHIDEIAECLGEAGNPTGVMLQVGTRNTQNFELLKAIGRQTQFPVLLKRGFGITLSESLNAAEYLATEGNAHVVFCLRGMKTTYSQPHRNLVDFGHVPVVKRLTRMPVCVDPSHSVGSRHRAPDGMLDVFHVTAQGVIAGANMVLVDFHPEPERALVDGPQALLLSELESYLADIRIVRKAYEERLVLHGRIALETD